MAEFPAEFWTVGRIYVTEIIRSVFELPKCAVKDLNAMKPLIL